MFDLRYHVASLAAVFLALVVGILVGVGISDRGLVDRTINRQLRDRVDELGQRLEAADQHATDLERQQRSAQTFVQQAYPAVMSGRLRGERVALLFVGSVDGGVSNAVGQTLSDAGADAPVRMRALKVPVTGQEVAVALEGRPALAAYGGDRNLESLGRALGEEFVAGGQTPLWAALSSDLVEERAGEGRRPVDAVVLVRSSKPQRQATARFLTGLYGGLEASGVPVVGVESSSEKTSAIGVYKRIGISSVDDVDTPAGRVSLAVLLSGREQGHFGVKTSADDGFVPPVAPLPVATTPGA